MDSQEEPLLKPFSPSHFDLPVPSSRSPQCRSLSFERATTVVEPLDGLHDPKPYLPLVLHCTICLRTSTWHNPMYRKFERNPPLDVLPSLSISSHSTSSESSSISTEFFSSVVMPPSADSSCVARVSSSLEDRFATSDGSDDHTPAALSYKSVVSDRQSSPRNTNWMGGGLEGICSSCHSSSPTTMVSQPIPTKSNLLLPCSHVPRCHRNVCSTSLTNYSHAQVISCPTESQPYHPTAQYTTGGIASPLPKHPSVPATKLVKTDATVPLLTRPDAGCPPSHAVKPVISLSIPSGRAVERPSPCDVQLVPNLPLKSNSSGAESIKRSLSFRTRKKQTTEMSSGLITKRDAPARDSSDSCRQEMNQRSTNLRTLLREAKIPQPESDNFVNSSRHHLTTGDKWQAAMIATPRDHLRHGDFPTWQLYGAGNSPFYQRPYGLSLSSSSLSGKETLCSTPVTSLRESPYGDSRPCSPASGKPLRKEPAPLSRRPSHVRPATSDTLVHHPSSEFSPPSSDAGPYMSVTSPNESQEILSGSALAKPRQPSPNISLIARLTNIHSSANKADRAFKRRPNTATGTTQSSSIVQSSPKPVAHGLGTPSPHPPAPSALPPSSFLAGSKAISAGLRVTNVNTYRRPATATPAGSRTGLSSSLSNDSTITRPLPIQNLATGKPTPAYVPTLPTIQGRGARNVIPNFTDDPQQSLPPLEFDSQPFQNLRSESITSSKISPVSVSPDLNSSPIQYSQSVPNFLLKSHLPAPKRNAFYAGTTLAATSDQLMHSDTTVPNPESSPWLQPEDFPSKSRNFILSILPRPTVTNFTPGQKLSVHLKLCNKTKVRKYTAIYLLLIGNTIDNAPQPINTHTFLRHNYLIYPNPSEEVNIISNSGDLSEWHLELKLPEYANCACTPGPLPLPSTGTHAAAKVCYSLQLHADRKHLLSTQESLSVKINVATRTEARYQVTTQPLRKAARKGRIPFAGGYLGSIDELSLSHQVYYQSADRLRIGYQFELQLSSNSSLPSSVAEDLSKATTIQVHTLMRPHPKECLIKFVDHRSKVSIIQPEEKDGCVKWIIKGFLELKGVSQQMKTMKATLESASRTLRRPENTMGSRGMLVSSHGSNAVGGGLTGPLGSSTNSSLQQETERQAKFNCSQLFLMANIDHCPGVLTESVELSSLIGSELLSPCALRKLGDEMMKKAVMAEKMKRVQEENFKNDQ